MQYDPRHYRNGRTWRLSFKYLSASPAARTKPARRLWKTYNPQVPVGKEASRKPMPNSNDASCLGAV